MIPLRYPVNYVAITSAFRSKERPNHTGVDLGWNSKYGGANAPIYAAANGKVIETVDGKVNDTSKNTAGNLIKVQHTNGVTTRYIHLLKGSLKVKVGDIVSQGQELAKMNNSGYSFGSHLHYDVWLDGVKVDPIKYTYLYEGQTVSANTDKSFKIMRFKDIPTPIPTPELKYKIGDNVVINGKLYGTADGGKPGKSVKNKKTKITRVVAGKKYPYNTTGDLGWIGEDQITLYKETNTFAVKDIVIPIKPISYTGKALTMWDKSYHITEIAGDRVVLAARRGSRLVVWAAVNINNIRKV